MFDFFFLFLSLTVLLPEEGCGLAVCLIESPFFSFRIKKKNVYEEKKREEKDEHEGESRGLLHTNKRVWDAVGKTIGSFCFKFSSKENVRGVFL